MREPTTKTIGDSQYRVRPLGAKRGCHVLARLSKLIGGALKSGVDAKNQLAMIGAALEQLEPADLDFFCDSFAPHTEVSVDGVKWPRLSDVFDAHFSQNYGEMIQWLRFSLEVNFEGFFGEAARSLGSGAPEAKA